jgi:hypothetical protein
MNMSNSSLLCELCVGMYHNCSLSFLYAIITFQGDKGDKGERGLTTTLNGDQFPTGIIEGPPGPPGPAGK